MYPSALICIRELICHNTVYTVNPPFQPMALRHWVSNALRRSTIDSCQRSFPIVNVRKEYKENQRFTIHERDCD